MKPVADIALGGRYRLVSRIAVGGMGEVWVGHDQALARNVAVKVLREEFAGDAGFLERFRAEARNSAQLSHANIAQLYDYGEQDGSGFLVMELVLGEPMSDLLDRQPVLPTRRLLPILAQTARALHAAHVAGVVHRDVKPGNILLARSGRVKITDFGISTASNQIPMTSTGMVMGTAQYLSPEQAIGRAATPASDVYSLGIVAYEGLVGHRPFTGPTAVDIAIAHVNTPVPPLPGDIDPALAALVMRMLAKEPEERPRSAASLARALDEMLDRTPPGGIPAPYGRHARTADLIDAAENDPRGHASTRPAPRPATGPVSGLPRPLTGPLAAAADAGASNPGGVPETGPDAERVGGPPSRSEALSSDTAAPAVATATTPGPGVPATAWQAGPADMPDATVVPGRPEAEAWLASEHAVPPVYEPQSRAPLPPTVAVGSTEPPGRARPSAPWTERVVRTSTTTGRRWGQVSRPLVVLVLMVLFALLGAAFADRLWGPSRALEPQDAGDPFTIVMVASAGADHGSGMISPSAGADDARNPTAPHTAAQTTTARDQ